MKIYKDISLQVDRFNVLDPIVVKQGDKDSRYLRATMKNDTEELNIPNSATVSIYATLPNGSVTNASGTAKSGKVIVPVDGVFASLDGTVKCEVTVTDGEAILTTADFQLQIQRNHKTGTVVDDDNNGTGGSVIADADIATLAEAKAYWGIK